MLPQNISDEEILFRAIKPFPNWWKFDITVLHLLLLKTQEEFLLTEMPVDKVPKLYKF